MHVSKDRKMEVQKKKPTYASFVNEMRDASTQKHLKSMQETMAKLRENYGQTKKDLLEQIEEVEREINVSLPSFTEVQG
jgi:hypothetical protein